MVATGVLCLGLSAEVARPGSWWQGTLDAFGVGFIAGGIIDVLVISGLDLVDTARDEKRQYNNRQAESLVQAYRDREQGIDPAYARRARDLLNSSEGNIDPFLASQLLQLVYLYPDQTPADSWLT